MNKRLEIQITDKVKEQVQECLRSHEKHLLEEKLVGITRKWFLKGFTTGMNFEKEQQGKN